MFANSVVYTSGKFAAGVVDTSGKLPPALLTPVTKLPLVSLTSMTNFPLVSTTLVKLVEKFAPVSLIPVVHIDLRISPRMFEKI